MNFDFIKECSIEDETLRTMYGMIVEQLEAAEWKYYREPQQCGIILRGTAELICKVYNYYYDAGYPENATLEEFLCYTDEDAHNARVSCFLSVLRSEQRARPNKLRVYGDDCILGKEGPDQGMTFEDRMAKNARHMMEIMMEVTKDMCERINKRDDVFDEFFLEEGLPESYESVFGVKKEDVEHPPVKKTWLGKLLHIYD